MCGLPHNNLITQKKKFLVSLIFQIEKKVCLSKTYSLLSLFEDNAHLDKMVSFAPATSLTP